MSGTGPNILTYLDSCVLIHAAKLLSQGANPDVSLAAWRVLTDPGRRFVVSPLLELELLPASRYAETRLRAKRRAVEANRVLAELQFYEKFLGEPGNVKIGLTNEVAEAAISLSGTVGGLGAIDALHAAVAQVAGAEFITDEAMGKPIHGLDPSTVKVTPLMMAQAATP